MREGQPPAICVPSATIASREPAMPRNTGSPLLPPLRITEKPGTVFSRSAPSLAGIGCCGALGSITVINGDCWKLAVTTTGESVLALRPPSSVRSLARAAEPQIMVMPATVAWQRRRRGVEDSKRELGCFMRFPMRPRQDLLAVKWQ